VSGKGYIVVVETDDLIRPLLERWLGEEGYSVVAPGQPAPARGELPCLVIANIADPGGADALIAGLRSAYRAPILALSARFRRGLGSSQQAARRLGVRRVLPKPFTRTELVLAVREALA